MEDGLFAADIIGGAHMLGNEPEQPLGIPGGDDDMYHGGHMQGGQQFPEFGHQDTTTFAHGGVPYEDAPQWTQRKEPMSTGYYAYENAPASKAAHNGHGVRKRLVPRDHADVENQSNAEWQQDVTSALNFAMSVEVRADFKRGTFANVLLIATIALMLISLGRGITSFIAQVFTVDINMEHLHIADVGIIVFGIFIVTTMFVFFYIMDYRKTTFSHKLTVMMPYILACIFYGGGVIAMWNFTRDHGAYVDRSDIVEIIKFQDAHQWFVTGAVLVIAFCFPAYYAHRFPEAETAQRYLLIPTRDLH